MADVTKIYGLLLKKYGKRHAFLHAKTPLETLIAVMLSAQCTDERVNKVTPSLFAKYPTALGYAHANLQELESFIRSTGFYHMKAKHIQEMAQFLVARHGGKVPDTMPALLELKGVARKTANIVLIDAFGKVEGIAVDTHVKRLAGRLGLSTQKNTDKIEADLMRAFPKKQWGDINYLLIRLGRDTCKAPTPTCSKCVLVKICPKKGVGKHY